MSQPFSLGQKVTVSIDRLAYHSGHGVGRSDGFVIFVPRGVPGDRADVEITELHASYAIGKIERLVQSSPERRPTPCPVAGECGGCHWQHINYEFQTKEKQRLLSESLRHLVKRVGELPLRPLIAAPEEYRYRNRIQVHRHGQEVGFFASGTNRLVPINDCWLAESAIAQALNQVRDRAKNPNLPNQERVEILRGKSGDVILRSAQSQEAIGFAQVNEGQNQRLIAIVRQATEGRPYREVLDLYCGAGNFTFPLAEQFPGITITGVESNRQLIDEAKRTAPTREPAIQWQTATTDSFLKRWQGQGQGLLLVLDPPRAGCDRATRDAISRIKPSQIVYVSCNPATLARDVDYWLSKAPYQIEFVQGVDMFPQTAHLEAVISLRLTD